MASVIGSFRRPAMSSGHGGGGLRVEVIGVCKRKKTASFDPGREEEARLPSGPTVPSNTKGKESYQLVACVGLVRASRRPAPTQGPHTSSPEAMVATARGVQARVGIEGPLAPTLHVGV